jgi:ubiquitin-conjugating enzyme E2 R
MRFVSPMYHPNIFPVSALTLAAALFTHNHFSLDFQDGRVCISILHPSGNDPMSGERPEERWLPTQSVRTVLLSVISMLDGPNTFSPANVDASVAYRKWKGANLKDYETRVKWVH